MLCAPRVFAALIGLSLFLAPAARAQCGPQWRPGLGPADLNGPVLAATAWDPDGPGPLPTRLIIGGAFTEHADLLPHLIAIWDSSAWKNLDFGFYEPIRALTTWDPDGPGPQPAVLIAAGDFDIASFQRVNYIARWTGATWIALGAGLNGPAHALTTWDPDGPGPQPELLIVGGDFTAASGALVAPHIAAWNGSAWAPLGTGLDGRVLALTSFDPDGPGPARPILIAAGAFTFAGAVPASRIAAWDGFTWQPLGTGLSSDPTHEARALVSFDPDGDGPALPRLIVGGTFASAGGLSASNIALWSPTTGWSALPAGLDNTVAALATADLDGPGPLPSCLIAAGLFTTTTPPGPALNHVAACDGSAWRPLATGTDAPVLALATIDPDGPGPRPHDLVIAGDFLNAGLPAPHVARWNSDHWQAFGSCIDSAISLIFDVVAHDFDGDGPQSPRLVAGGTAFATAGGQTVNDVAAWDGAEWHPIGAGLAPPGATGVRALASWDPDGTGPMPASLYAGGELPGIAPGLITTLAQWRDDAWHHIFPPPPVSDNATVFAITTWDPDGPGPQVPVLILGGEFNFPTPAGQLRAVATWDGHQILPVGPPPGGPVISLTSWDPDGPGPASPLLVAGSDEGPDSLRTWNGSAWTAIPVPFSAGIGSLTPWDPDGDGPAPPVLAAATTRGVMTWNGSAWTTLTGVPGPSLWDLTVWDPDADGPKIPTLVVSGQFLAVPSTFGVALWSGSKWLALLSGLDSSSADGRCLITWDPDGPGPIPSQLIVGGRFRTAGHLPSRCLAHWSYNAPFFASQPAGESVTAGQTARLSTAPAIGLETTSALSYQWRRNGQALSDGPTPHGSTIAGAATATLFIAAAQPDDAGDYTCTITNACASTSSDPAALSITPCLADLIDDGQVDFADYLEFLNLYDSLDLRADFNGDGLVDFSDYLEFLNHYDAGC